jgi:DNA-binding NtrC family response regulator
MADGGTIFFDEIGDLPLEKQAGLLRVFTQGGVEPVGSNKFIKVDCRVIAATNKDLTDKTICRPDFYYRINVISIAIPPLRDRPSDILPIAEHLLLKFNSRNGRAINGFSEDAKQKMLKHKWPGNARELSNKIEQAVVLAEGSDITTADLMLDHDCVDEGEMTPEEKRTRVQLLEFAIAVQNQNGNFPKASEAIGRDRGYIRKILDKFTPDKWNRHICVPEIRGLRQRYIDSKKIVAKQNLELD